MALVNYAIIVSGKVQGVFYRASARDVANDLGLSGVVRNEKNGDVYVEVQGNKDVVDKFISWCKVGPRNAVVSCMEVKAQGLKDYSGFSIIRS